MREAVFGIKAWIADHIRVILIVLIAIALTTSIVIVAVTNRARFMKAEEPEVTYDLSEIPVTADAGVIILDTAGQYVNLSETEARIDIDGVTLSNSSVDRLEIGEAVGDGTVDLQNDTVSTLIINGGGQHSVYLSGGDYDLVVSNDEDCHIVVGTGASVERLYALDSSLIDVFGHVKDAVIFKTTYLGEIGWERGLFTFEGSSIDTLMVSAESEGYEISMQKDTVGKIHTYKKDDLSKSFDDVDMLAIETVEGEEEQAASEDTRQTTQRATANASANRRQEAAHAEGERAEAAAEVKNTATASNSAPAYIAPAASSGGGSTTAASSNTSSSATPSSGTSSSTSGSAASQGSGTTGGTTASTGGSIGGSSSTGGNAGGGNTVSDTAAGGDSGSSSGGNTSTGEGTAGGDTTGGGTGADGGNTGGDAGVPAGDGGATGGDAGTTGGDAGTPTGDGQATGGDAGTTGGDAGTPTGDGGTAGGDAGTTGGDAGTPAGDGGTTEGDTGGTTPEPPAAPEPIGE